MAELSHRVRVFVFEMKAHDPAYLLLRSAQGIESFWTPVHGTIGFGEQMDSAIQREVLDDTGLVRPRQVLDLRMTSRLVLGDEEIIEWNFGFQASHAPEGLQLDQDRWAEFRWASFAEAYPALEHEYDRAAIMRLHTMLSEAA